MSIHRGRSSGFCGVLMWTYPRWIPEFSSPEYGKMATENPKTIPQFADDFFRCSDVPMKTSSNPNLLLLVFGLKKMIFQHFSSQVWPVNWSVGVPEVCIPFKGMPDPQWPAVCWWRPSFFKVNHPNPWAMMGHGSFSIRFFSHQEKEWLYIRNQTSMYSVHSKYNHH